MNKGAGMKNLEVWYSKIDLDDLMPVVQAQLDKKRVKTLEKNLAKARTKDSMHAFEKLTHDVDGEPQIISDPPLIVPIEELTDVDRDALYGVLAGVIRSYRRTLSNDRRHLLDDFHMVHVARKVVGVGSVGTRAWIMLLLGRDGQDPLFLQAKEAQESVLERFVGVSRYANHGQRVVAGQRLMQASSDIFLGWDRVQGFDEQRRDFYVRQLKDWKGSAEIATMDPAGMARLRAAVRGDDGPRARPVGRPDRDRLLPGQERHLRSRDRRVLGRVRRPERPGPRGPAWRRSRTAGSSRSRGSSGSRPDV